MADKFLEDGENDERKNIMIEVRRDNRSRQRITMKPREETDERGRWGPKLSSLSVSFRPSVILSFALSLIRFFLLSSFYISYQLPISHPHIYAGGPLDGWEIEELVGQPINSQDMADGVRKTVSG